MTFNPAKSRIFVGISGICLGMSLCLSAATLARPAMKAYGKISGKGSKSGSTTTTSGSTTTTSGSTTTTTTTGTSSGGLLTTTSSSGTIDTTGTVTTSTTSTTSDSTATITGASLKVTDTASLHSAIQAATTPITLVLAPGNYDVVTLYAKSGITLKSYSESSPAVLRALNINGSSNIIVDNIKIAGSSTNLAYRLQVLSSTGVTLTRIDIPGVSGTFDAPVSSAVMLRKSSNVLLSNFNIGWATTGVSYLDVSNTTIQNGVVHDIMVDGMHGGGVNGLTIRGNDISRFHPNGVDHPDGIQLWTTNTTAPSTDILIQDNLISRDGLGIAQGIFIRDTYLTLPFVNVKVANNVVAGGMYNGIMISGATTASFTNNTVIGYPDMISRIRVEYAQDATVEDSQANQFLLALGVGSGGNAIVAQSVADADQAAYAWRSTHGY